MKVMTFDELMEELGSTGKVDKKHLKNSFVSLMTEIEKKVAEMKASRKEGEAYAEKIKKALHEEILTFRHHMDAPSDERDESIAVLAGVMSFATSMAAVSLYSVLKADDDLDSIDAEKEIVQQFLNKTGTHVIKKLRKLKESECDCNGDDE